MTKLKLYIYEELIALNDFLVDTFGDSTMVAMFLAVLALYL
jgi:hypothetical protein